MLRRFARQRGTPSAGRVSAWASADGIRTAGSTVDVDPGRGHREVVRHIRRIAGLDVPRETDVARAVPVGIKRELVDHRARGERERELPPVNDHEWTRTPAYGEDEGIGLA